MRKQILFTSLFIAIAAFSAALIWKFKITISETDDRTKAVNLIIYAPSSFSDSYGPGPLLKEQFEKVCQCTVEFIDAGSSDAVIQQMALDPERRVDLLLGIDVFQIESLAKSVRLKSINRAVIEWHPEVARHIFSDRILPFDWSPMGFIYREGKTKIYTSWSDLLASGTKSSLALQEPSLTSTGLQWLYWFFVLNGIDSLKLKSFNQLAHSYSPSWSGAYGLFRAGQTPIVFSYLTSLLYHWFEKNERAVQFMSFEEGHPISIEYAAIPNSCWNCGAAESFLQLMLSPAGQEILYKKNFMLPVTAPDYSRLVSKELPKLKFLKENKFNEFSRDREKIIEAWKQSR